jgi:hypothetical protein
MYKKTICVPDKVHGGSRRNEQLYGVRTLTLKRKASVWVCALVRVHQRRDLARGGEQMRDT